MRQTCKTLLPTIAILLLIVRSSSFTFLRPRTHSFLPSTTPTRIRTDNCNTPAINGLRTVLSSTPSNKEDEEGNDAILKEKSEEATAITKEEKEEKIGNLVADDEWNGLTMELSEIIRCAVVEDMKKNARDFLGKDDYKIGDVTKEIDSRVKNEVALLRGKEEYELGDLVLAMDEISKDVTCQLSGKDEYEFGDLSREIDQRVKSSVARFCDKDEYELGDLSKEIDRRVKERVTEFTGKDDYEFGDVAREINNRREKWVMDYLGEEAAKNYQFGDITKKAIAGFTGKEEYEFGDVTKKIMGNLFGKRKKGKE